MANGSKPRNSSDMTKSACLNTIIMNLAIENLLVGRASKIGFFSRPNLIFTSLGDWASANFEDCHYK
jgi:hypothetical protein